MLTITNYYGLSRRICECCKACVIPAGEYLCELCARDYEREAAIEAGDYEVSGDDDAFEGGPDADDKAEGR